MPSITVTIQNDVGLHARPAALFVETSKKFQSDINVKFNGREANAKSILQILGLGANQGSEINIHAEGEDAEDTLIALRSLVENNFGEDLSD